jgi:FkbM family methyltransferase
VHHLNANGCGDVEVLSVALSDEPGEGRLYLDPGGDIGKTTMRVDSIEHRPTEIVQTSTLDVIWSEYGRPSVGLVKVDVEGLEGEVLVGALEMIARKRPALVVEVSPDLFTHSKVERAARELHRMGYGWTTADEVARGDRKLRNDGLIDNLQGQTNVVFIARADWPG